MFLVATAWRDCVKKDSRKSMSRWGIAALAVCVARSRAPGMCLGVSGVVSTQQSTVGWWLFLFLKLYLVHTFDTVWDVPRSLSYSEVEC